MNTELDKHKDEHFASRSAELASNFTAAVVRPPHTSVTHAGVGRTNRRLFAPHTVAHKWV